MPDIKSQPKKASESKLPSKHILIYGPIQNMLNISQTNSEAYFQTLQHGEVVDMSYGIPRKVEVLQGTVVG